jgi:RNA polymerase-binding transcription factor DksA
MKDDDIRRAIKEESIRVQNSIMSDFRSMQQAQRKTFDSQIKTAYDTIHNLTARLRKLELESHPECKECGQELPKVIMRELPTETTQACEEVGKITGTNWDKSHPFISGRDKY